MRRTAALFVATLGIGLVGSARPPADDGPASPDAPVPAAEAAGRFALPEGFTATLFAGEPDVVQPIAFTIDPRGRLWVAECYSYPDWSRDGHGRDRILILEDTDGDGRHDRRTVFLDRVANLSGLEVGFGGVWACATPNLLFIPDRDGDDVPDGEPEVVLDGWSLEARHNVFNGLTWGPDGWLYGCNGILATSLVGPPGTPDDRRTAMNCGVWRLHPTRRTFEVVAHGTTNPWGLDFDEQGEMFITNCVIPHLFHVVPGAHYQRMYGQDLTPNVYELLATCADHVHWDTVEQWSDIRMRGVTPTTDRAGGGHAHVGAMIYLGDNWPASYRGSVLTCNVHGNRVNRDSLRRSGSTFVASHEPDFLLANDPWFRGLELQYGPDGAVYVTDWSDTGECHEDDADGAHRENGRIFKVAHGTPGPVRVDLARLGGVELVRVLDHPNAWYGRTARRLLQERTWAAGERDEVREALRERFAAGDESRALRALWALNAIGDLDESDLRSALGHAGESLRTWAVRLLGDIESPGDETLRRLAALAGGEPSPRVRLALASLLQRIPASRRWPIAGPLASRPEDAEDAMIPLMVWYGLEPLVSSGPGEAVRRSAGFELPVVRRLVARRAVEADPVVGLSALAGPLAGTDDPARLRDWLDGALEALRGRRSVERPDGWDAASRRLAAHPDPEVRERASMVALRFGDPDAAAALRAVVNDARADPGRRARALQALVGARAEGLTADLHALVRRGDLLGPAIEALAAFDDPETPRVLIGRYASLPPDARDDALGTLAARPASARALLDAIADGAIPRRDLSVTLARQILASGDARLAARLEEVWGATRPTSRQKSALMARYKALLTPEALARADLPNGRAVFERTCLQCHKLYGVGGDVGPELTGSDRGNLDYLLENVLDPGASVGRDYALMVVATADGRLLTGIVREQTDAALVLQTANERVVLARDDVEEVRAAGESMMPEGLFENLSDAEVRDLVAYLAAREPTPPPDSRRPASPPEIPDR